MVTFGDGVNQKILDGVSKVLINVCNLICGVVSWVMFYMESHQAILNPIYMLYTN